MSLIDTDSNTTQSDPSALSLLSLSIAAANATPIALPLSPDSQHTNTLQPAPPVSGTTPNGIHLGVQGTTSTLSSGFKQHRRLSSTGKARRRLSDARDAAARPSPAALQTNGLAPLLLSASLPTQGLSTISPVLFPSKSPHGPTPIPIARKHSASIDGTPMSPSLDESTALASPLPINGTKFGKKKGMDHKCETCSKIYRHPSCLIKHRWEHTPHWREASKFVLSKHQQVQLLEAAAILSHLSPSSATGTLLPEDRSLWPSFLSGGALPPPTNQDTPIPGSAQSFPSASYPLRPVSTSVPATSALTTRATSVGPRLHDYAISGSSNITQLRPGLIGIPNHSDSTPTPPAAGSGSGSGSGAAASSGSLPVPVPVPSTHSGSIYPRRRSASNPWDSHHHHHHHHHHSSSYTSGWSLPRSSLRSVSGSSPSRSRSSRSDDESELMMDEEGEISMMVGGDARRGYHHRYAFGGRRAGEWKGDGDEDEGDGDGDGDDEMGYAVVREEEDEEERVEEKWDGMEMEMEMD